MRSKVVYDLNSDTFKPYEGHVSYIRKSERDSDMKIPRFLFTILFIASIIFYITAIVYAMKG